jgi:hypothetical protein
MDEGVRVTENPYGQYVAGRDVLASLAETPARIEALVSGWDETAFERSYGPGKWSARQILIHLAQAELVFSTRVRFALAESDYVIQPFDQDPWLAVETTAGARLALDAYLAIRRLNLPLWRGLSPAQRARRFTHPAFGEVDVDWQLTLIAGHELNHLPQFEAIQAGAQ